MTTPEFAISIIIPVLGDTPALTSLLQCLRASERQPAEIIVADAAKEQACQQVCSEYDARYLATSAGRGPQLRAAAAEASGDALWFLHADTRPSADALQAIAESLNSGAVGGCCHFRFAGRSTPMRRWLEAMINWRAGVGVPYGDQGIFAAVDAYARAGGFAAEPLFEEVPLVKGLRRLGRFDRLAAPIDVSTRRWEQQGWLRRSLANRALAVGYMLGVSPGTLARHYRPMAKGKDS